MTSLQNLFVAKLPRNITDSELEKIFEPYKPESAKVMLDAATGKSKGFGFVLFDSEEEGELAFKELNKTHVTLHGHSFNLCIFPSKHDGKVAKEISNALYIRNIPQRLSQAEVEEFLRTFGNLTYCAMREDHYGSPVWVVYAEYETVEDAKNTLNKLHGNGTYFPGSAALLAKYADTEETKRERRRRRREQYQPHNIRGTMSSNASSHASSKPWHSASQAFPATANEEPVTAVDGPISVSFTQRYSPFGAPSTNGNGMVPQVPCHYNHYRTDSTTPVSSGNRGPLTSDILPTATVPPLASTFLNVTFPTMTSVNSDQSTRMSALEQCSVDHPTSATPLSFSLGPEGVLDTSGNFAANLSPLNATPGAHSCGNAGLAAEMPTQRSGTLSARGSMHYRHNPYSILTPISSEPSTPSPSTPRGVTSMLSGGALAHFGGGNHNNCSTVGSNCLFSGSASNNTSGFFMSPAHGGTQNGSFTGYSHNHFAKTASHGVIATSSMNINSFK